MQMYCILFLPEHKVRHPGNGVVLQTEYPEAVQPIEGVGLDDVDEVESEVEGAEAPRRPHHLGHPREPVAPQEELL